MQNRKTALITGASRGIGSAIALELANKGYYILINYRNSPQAANALKSQIQNLGGEAELIEFDAGSRQKIRDAIKDIGVSCLDILVNNAGITRDNLVLSTPIDDWKEVIRSNFFSAFFTYNECDSLLRKSSSPIVINIASISGFIGGKGQSSYAASKAMLIEWTKRMMDTHDRHGIRFHVISPGPVATDMIKSAAFYKDKASYKIFPMHRFGEPYEIGRLVAFLADCESLDGSYWVIDGGFSLSVKS